MGAGRAVCDGGGFKRSAGCFERSSGLLAAGTSSGRVALALGQVVIALGAGWFFQPPQSPPRRNVEVSGTLAMAPYRRGCLEEVLSQWQANSTSKT